jgi:hypothetical protein
MLNQRELCNGISRPSQGAQHLRRHQFAMTSPRKPTAGFWITVALIAVLVGYPLSFGPACWITSRSMTNGDWISRAYAPTIWAWNNCEDPVWDIISHYAFLGASPDWVWEADEKGGFTNFVPRSPDP